MPAVTRSTTRKTRSQTVYAKPEPSKATKTVAVPRSSSKTTSKTSSKTLTHTKNKMARKPASKRSSKTVLDDVTTIARETAQAERADKMVSGASQSYCWIT